MQITKEQAQKIIEAADEVITALAGTNEDVHPESENMLRLWDDLNDRYAPPEVVRELARIALERIDAKAVALRDERSGSGGISKQPGFNDLPHGTRLYTVPPAPVVPEGWIMVPIEPTESMIVDGFESEPDEDFSQPEVWEEYQEMSGCQQAAHRAKLCWEAMIKAAPKPENI
ncbi:hypothetical protein [Enterobacter kobei]